MSQPQFQPQSGQPPQQPQGPPQPPQYNPYAGQPGVPQQPPGPPVQAGPGPFGPPPMPPQPPGQAPGQPPMHPPGPPGGQPGWPGQPQQGMPAFPVQPGAQQPKSGSPAGAFFLALLVSFLLSLLYAVGRGVAWDVITTSAVAITVWAVATLVNGAAVGLVAGKFGGSSPGVWVGAAVVGVLGAFFSSTNAIVAMTIAARDWSNFVWMWKEDPFFPAVSWWGGDLWWLSPISLVVAGSIAFALAAAVGKKRS